MTAGVKTQASSILKMSECLHPDRWAVKGLGFEGSELFIVKQQVQMLGFRVLFTPVRQVRIKTEVIPWVRVSEHVWFHSHLRE